MECRFQTGRKENSLDHDYYEISDCTYYGDYVLRMYDLLCIVWLVGEEDDDDQTESSEF